MASILSLPIWLVLVLFCCLTTTRSVTLGVEALRPMTLPQHFPLPSYPNNSIANGISVSVDFLLYGTQQPTAQDIQLSLDLDGIKVIKEPWYQYNRTIAYGVVRWSFSFNFTDEFHRKPVKEVVEMFNSSSSIVVSGLLADVKKLFSFRMSFSTTTWIPAPNVLGHKKSQATGFYCAIYCALLGGTLTSIRTESEQDAAVAEMKRLGMNEAWIGLTNVGSGGAGKTYTYCWVGDPNFSIAGCRAGNSALAYSKHAINGKAECHQEYCNMGSIDGNVGDMVRMVAPKYEWNDQPASNKKQGCLCDFPTKAGSVNYMNGPYIYQSFVSIRGTSWQYTESLSQSVTHSYSLLATVTEAQTLTPSFSKSFMQKRTLSKQRTVSITTSLHSKSPTGSASLMLTSSVSMTPSHSPTGMTPSLTATREVPRIIMTQPSGGRIEELAISKKKIDENRRVQFILTGKTAEWNCSFILKNIYFLMESSSENQTWGFTKLKTQIIPKTSVVCGAQTLTITFARVRTYQIETPDNITVALPGQYCVNSDNPSLNLQHTYDFQTSFVIVPEPPRPADAVSEEVLESAKTTAAVSSVMTSISGNPAMAVQGARTGLIIELAKCEDNTEDGLGTSESPLGLEIGQGITKAFAGACLGNLIFVFSFMFLHFLVVFCRAEWVGLHWRRMLSNCWFPALQTMFILPLLQPTVMAIVTVFRQGNEIIAYVFAFIAIICVSGFQYFILRITVLKFDAIFLTGEELGEEYSKLRIFMMGDGEYRDKADGGTTFVEKYFLFFDCYKDGKTWFSTLEVLLTILFGIIEGWRPSSKAGCQVIVVIMFLLFLLFLVLILIHKPYNAYIDFLVALGISLLQVAGSIATVVYSFSSVEKAVRVGEWSATAGLYVMGFKTLLDLGNLAMDMCRDRVHLKDWSNKLSEKLHGMLKVKDEKPLLVVPEKRKKSKKEVVSEKKSRAKTQIDSWLKDQLPTSSRHASGESRQRAHRPSHRLPLQEAVQVEMEPLFNPLDAANSSSVALNAVEMSADINDDGNASVGGALTEGLLDLRDQSSVFASSDVALWVEDTL